MTDTPVYVGFFLSTPIPERGVRVVTLWRLGKRKPEQTVERRADGMALMTRPIDPVQPDPEADLAARHWSLCECIRLGIAVFGDDPADAASGEEAQHGAA